MELRLRTSKTEATKEVLALAKDMYVGDAIALVIESMPAKKTQQLRRWNDSWAGWCEWVDWADQGWTMRTVSTGIVSVLPPAGWRPTKPNHEPSPSADAVAAALDVASVKFMSVGHYAARDPWLQFLYRVR